MPDIFNKSLLSEEFPDFHGRISTEDYELITRGPPLPPRTFPCRNSPLTKENWSINLDDNGRILEHELIKEIIFHGVVV